MKIDLALTDYVRRNEQAIFSNPPRSWPIYQQDPIYCWRYFARCFGHGLAAFDEKQVRDVVTNLYGRWFVRLEFMRNMPKIDNKDFIEWILGAMKEAKQTKWPAGA